MHPPAGREPSPTKQPGHPSPPVPGHAPPPATAMQVCAAAETARGAVRVADAAPHASVSADGAGAPPAFPPRCKPSFMYDPVAMPLPERDDRGQLNWFVTPQGAVAPPPLPLPPPPPGQYSHPPPPPADPAAEAAAMAARETARASDAFAAELERRAKATGVASEEARADHVRFGQPGWKERYYRTKFKIDSPADRARVCEEYVRGLCWVLKYYYQGCPSWEWFYPFHYAPPASDLRGMAGLDRVKKFSAGEPFSPLEQLMAVLPPRSAARALPACYASLMDSGSPLAHLYPVTFQQDLNGAASWWKAVALLPFIDRNLLRQHLEVRRRPSPPLYPLLF
eukprot:scaffold20100_cov97-Isochrysis_galbana.AAC.3